MAINRQQTKLIHVARRQLNLTDADYRAILLHYAGCESSKELDSQGLNAVMRRFQELGFKPSSNPGHRRGMATPAQVAYIKALWGEYTDGEGTDRSLGKWLSRIAKVDDISFADYAAARKAITGLKAMVAKKAETSRAAASPAA